MLRFRIVQSNDHLDTNDCCRTNNPHPRLSYSHRIRPYVSYDSTGFGQKRLWDKAEDKFGRIERLTHSGPNASPDIFVFSFRDHSNNLGWGFGRKFVIVTRFESATSISLNNRTMGRSRDQRSSKLLTSIE
jgi:hypothetical protein